MVVPGTMFEELGFNYIGPVDGHDVSELVKTLKNMRNLKGPQFLHIMTKKGKGYEPAERDPIGYHACLSSTLPTPLCQRAKVVYRPSLRYLVTSYVIWQPKTLS